MKLFSKAKCGIIFLFVFFIARPISYEDWSWLREIKRNHDQSSEINFVVRNHKPRSQINKPLNEYDSLMGSGNDLILAAFRGKFLVKYA